MVFSFLRSLMMHSFMRSSSSLISSLRLSPPLPLSLSSIKEEDRAPTRSFNLSFFFTISLSLSLSLFLFISLSSSIYFLSKLLEDGPGQDEKGWPVGRRGEGMNCRREVWGLWMEERERERAGGEKERRSEFKDVCTHLLRRSHN